MNTSITSGITDGQKKQYKRVVEDAIIDAEEVVFSKVRAGTEGWQRVIERGDELRTAIIETVVEKTREFSITNQFADEEVGSNYTYPDEYRGPQPIPDQIARLVGHFPGLDGVQAIAFAKSLPKLPEGAEGWFTCPSIAALAKLFFAEVTDPAERYCRAVNLILEKIGDSRKFHNYRQGELTPDRFQMHARTAKVLDTLGQQQPGDILLIPAQFGMRHRGRSTRRAREVISNPEFGLGAFTVGCMILTHPERLVHWEQLHIDCPGDKFSADADGQFAHAPFFLFYDDEVKFGARRVSDAFGPFGSASGFLPQ